MGDMAVVEEGTLSRAISELRSGRVVAVVGEGRRALLMVAAQFVTPELLKPLLQLSDGHLMLAMDGSRWGSLRRAGTSQTADPTAMALSIQRAIRGDDDGFDPAGAELPLPFLGSPDGVLDRPEPGEAAVDLARLAGLQPAAVICRPHHEFDGSRIPPVLGGRPVPIVTVAELLRHRLTLGVRLERAVTVNMPTRYGEFIVVGYESSVPLAAEPIALVTGEVEGIEDVPVLVHCGCVFGDVFRSRGCGCSERLRTALVRLGEIPEGVVVRLEGGAIGACDAGAHPDEFDRMVVDRVIADLGIRSTVPLLEEPREGWRLQRCA